MYCKDLMTYNQYDNPILECKALWWAELTLDEKQHGDDDDEHDYIF